MSSSESLPVIREGQIWEREETGEQVKVLAEGRYPELVSYMSLDPDRLAVATSRRDHFAEHFRLVEDVPHHGEEA